MQVATVEKQIWSSKALLNLWTQRIVVRQRAGFRVTVSPVRRIERQPTQLRLEPELSKHPNCIRALLDAGADPRKCARLLVDLNSYTDPQERRRSRKSSNTRANDRDFQFFLRQGSRPGNVVEENVRTGRANSQGRLHCRKVGAEIHWKRPAVFGTSLRPSSRSTPHPKMIAVPAAPIAAGKRPRKIVRRHGESGATAQP